MSSSEFDVLIHGGKIVDGTGNPWFFGDVAIKNDQVAAVERAGRIPHSAAAELVDAAGHVVCPGFIDIQSHAILPLMHDGRCLSKITQGVTTEIMGEGWTPAPVAGHVTDPFADRSSLPPGDWAEQAKTWTSFGDWLRAMEASGVSPNVGSFLGGGTLREIGKSMAMGSATDDELQRHAPCHGRVDGRRRLRRLLRPDLPARCLRRYRRGLRDLRGRRPAPRGLHHPRPLRSRLAWKRASPRRSRSAGAPAWRSRSITSRPPGRRNWHKMPNVIDAINAARAEGIDVTADMYPYIASGTGLTAILPPWASAEGKLYDNLNDPEMRAKIRAEVLEPSGMWETFAAPGQPRGHDAAWASNCRSTSGTSASACPRSPRNAVRDWIDAALDLLAAERQRISTVYFNMTEDNLATPASRSPGSRSRPTRAASIPPGRRSAARSTPAAMAPTPASWASTSARRVSSASKTRSAR